MHRIEIPEFGGPQVLSLVERPDVHPEAGEVRVHTHAAGVNFADLMCRMGVYDGVPPLPATVGWELSGVIDEVGAGVPSSRLGERVAVICNMGGYATRRVVPEHQAIATGDLDPILAAAVPVHGLSAWMMCMEMARVRPGDRVLVHAAGGGLGLMLVQLLKHHECTVVGTASAGKHERLLAAGYDRLIDYRTEDFREVLEGDERFDLVLDPVGGRSWKKSFELLRSAGKLICYGFSSAIVGHEKRWFALLRSLRQTPWFQFLPRRLQTENKGVFGMELQHLWHEQDRMRRMFVESLQLVHGDVMRPVLHAQVPFSNAAEAHRILHDRENFGKVVLVNDVD